MWTNSPQLRQNNTPGSSGAPQRWQWVSGGAVVWVIDWIIGAVRGLASFFVPKETMLSRDSTELVEVKRLHLPGVGRQRFAEPPRFPTKRILELRQIAGVFLLAHHNLIPVEWQ